MRFFFHLHDGADTHDEEGTELPDEAAAHLRAQEEARTMAAESVREGYLDLSNYIEVTDSAETPLFKVTFGEVVEVTS